MYDKDEPFRDPVVRCDSCSRLILTAKLREMGHCLCGSRKVRNVLSYTGPEHEAMLKWGVDPNFIKLFEAIDDTGVGPKP